MAAMVARCLVAADGRGAERRPEVGRETGRCRRGLVAAALAVALAAPAVADAQVIEGNGRPGLELRLFRPAVDSKGLFTINGSPILPHLAISFGLILDYGYGVMRMADAYDPALALVEHNLWGTLHFNLGLFNWAVIGVQLPVGLNFGTTLGREAAAGWGGDLSQDALVDGWQASMIGDVALHAKFRFLRLDRFPVGVAAVLQLNFMTGDAPGMLGDPGNFGLTSVWAQAVLDGQPTRRFRWAVNVGYRLVLAEGPTLELPNGRTFSYDDQLTFGAGVSLNLVLSRLDFVAEVYGNSPIGSFFDWQAGGLPLEAAIGLKIFIERNSYLYLGVASGAMGPGYSASLARVFAAWVFEPSIGDRDGDGIPDDIDQCPDDPEDFDGFEDDDGCPDPDNDRDGIPDVDDECPNVPEDFNGFEDEDGCPDGDVGDRDGDGIPDDVDQCPDDPEDFDGFEDEDGCPDPDNDGDGILDVDDLCPNDPEDFDGFEDEDGCPDPDNDGDGILDVDDMCPNEPEVYNGVEDEDGCPDEGGIDFATSDAFVLEGIEFEYDSARIRPSSYPTLDMVASALRGNPQITLVEVQGHTDERGTDEYNIRLSRDRAASVVSYLVTRHRIDRGRLRSAGYGERCPVVEGRGEAVWARNRRVEFKVIRTATGPTGVQVTCEAGRELMPVER